MKRNSHDPIFKYIFILCPNVVIKNLKLMNHLLRKRLTSRTLSNLLLFQLAICLQKQEKIVHILRLEESYPISQTKLEWNFFFFFFHSTLLTLMGGKKKSSFFTLEFYKKHSYSLYNLKSKFQNQNLSSCAT